MNVVKVNRRDFVKISAVAGAGLALAVHLPSRGQASAKDIELGAFVHIGTDGTTTIYVPRSEMGQGVRTSLAQIVAEELDADWKKVRVRTPPLGEKYGDQGTGGSGSVQESFAPLRIAGATARAMLVAAAADKWGVDYATCTTANGVITSGAHSIGYGEIAEAAAKGAVPTEVALKHPRMFTLIGKSPRRVDNDDVATGKAIFGIDVRVPGMLYAAIARSPVFEGKVASFDDTKAKQIPGVKHVVRVDSPGKDMPWNGVAVVATSTWAAIKGRDALDVKWDEGPGASETTASLRQAMLEALDRKEATSYRKEGDTDAALASAAKKIEATYESPYLAHATLEPMNATASVTADGVEIWAPTQFPDWVGRAVGTALGLKPNQIKVNVTLLGGGFGRRINPDYAVEAALVSKAVGAPVHVQWTREDDMTHDFYRPPMMHKLSAAIDADGKVTAYTHRVTSPPIRAWYRGDDAKNIHQGEGGGIADCYFTIPNLKLDFAAVKSRVPRGWLRSVSHGVNTFVVQSFIDELAHAAGKDPIEFQIALLGDKRVITPTDASEKDYPYESERFKHVIELAREKSGWGKPLPVGRGRGFAAQYYALTYIAEVAEVTVKSGEVKVDRVTCAIDCGTAINPDGIAGQVESGIVFALSAMKAGITIDGGRVQQANFHDYPLARMSETPHVDTYIVPSLEKPTGVGEPPVPPLAAAVANAVFAATGKRVRSLPLKLA